METKGTDKYASGKEFYERKLVDARERFESADNLYDRIGAVEDFESAQLQHIQLERRQMLEQTGETEVEFLLITKAIENEL